jgi:type IV secretory pathway VirB10-like protein
MSNKTLNKQSNTKNYLLIFIAIAISVLAVALVLFNINKTKDADPKQEPEVLVEDMIEEGKEDVINSEDEEVKMDTEVEDENTPPVPPAPIIEVPKAQ